MADNTKTTANSKPEDPPLNYRGNVPITGSIALTFEKDTYSYSLPKMPEFVEGVAKHDFILLGDPNKVPLEVTKVVSPQSTQDKSGFQVFLIMRTDEPDPKPPAPAPGAPAPVAPAGASPVQQSKTTLTYRVASADSNGAEGSWIEIEDKAMHLIFGKGIFQLLTDAPRYITFKKVGPKNVRVQVLVTGVLEDPKPTPAESETNPAEKPKPYPVKPVYETTPTPADETDGDYLVEVVEVLEEGYDQRIDEADEAHWPMGSDQTQRRRG
jgi:hypothetical protein